MRIFSNTNTPNAFIFRKVHSLTGLGIVIFLCSHLVTNARAALPLGNDGSGFIGAVNAIQAIPGLKIIEVLALAIPILLHLVLGIKYLRTSEPNAYGKDPTKPILHYPRNYAYSWQRITSWILVVGVIAHVVHMRFIRYPEAVEGKQFQVKITHDAGLASLATRLNVQLSEKSSEAKGESNEQLLTAKTLDFGTADLLVVRDAFKSPITAFLYSLLVASSCFHAFNGLSIFLISFGITLKSKSQRLMSFVSILLTIAFTLLGLAAIWLTYWVNLNN